MQASENQMRLRGGFLGGVALEKGQHCAKWTLEGRPGRSNSLCKGLGATGDSWWEQLEVGYNGEARRRPVPGGGPHLLGQGSREGGAGWPSRSLFLGGAHGPNWFISRVQIHPAPAAEEMLT